MTPAPYRILCQSERRLDLEIIEKLQMILIISIFKEEEDNIFSVTANLPYSPPVNKENDYQTFSCRLFCKGFCN